MTHRTPTIRSDDDLVRWREALREDVELVDDGAACCSADVLWESAAGNLAADAERSVILHIGECTVCATSWELAREMAPQQEISARPVRATPLRLGLGAVAALFLLSVGIWIWQPTPEREAVYRDTSGDWIVSGLTEGRSLTRDAAVLRWSAGPPGTSYDIHVTAADLTPLARGVDLDRPSYSIDPTALAELPARTELLWRVKARLPDGSRVSSITFRTAVE